MTGRSVRAALLGGVLGIAAMAGMLGPTLGSAPAAAGGLNHAGLIVDTGSGPQVQCVSFAEPSISGLELLERAGADPVVHAYSGQGGAVCGIDGVGCPADSSCLTCMAPNYWAYHRSEAGSDGFTYSQAAASSTSVEDGDVEGWKWGTGSAPSYRDFETICPTAPPPTEPPPVTTPPPGGGDHGGGAGGGGSGGGSGDGGGDTGSPGGGPDDTVAPGTTVPGATTTIAPDEGPTTTVVGEGDDHADDESIDGAENASATEPGSDDDSGGTPVWALVGVAGVLGLVGWRVVKVRGRSTPA